MNYVLVILIKRLTIKIHMETIKLARHFTELQTLSIWLFR